LTTTESKISVLQKISDAGASRRETGGIAIQIAGTLAAHRECITGADSPPACSPRCELVDSKQGERRIHIPDFHNAYKQMDLRPTIVAAFVPRLSDHFHTIARLARASPGNLEVVSREYSNCRRPKSRTCASRSAASAPIPIRCERTEIL